MLHIVISSLLLFVSPILFSCSPKPSSPSPETKTIAEPPIATMSKPGWESEWDKALKQARNEGRVVVYGPPMAEVRARFTEVFQKAYPGIMLEYTGMGGSQTSPKISAERRAGIYIVDVHIGGTSTILTALRQFAAPIKPQLVLPEVIDAGKWMEGRLEFSDNAAEVNLIFTIRANSNVAFNSELVNPGEISSFWDLASSKWSGKVIIQDPRIAGTGLSVGAYLYFHPQLGPDFLKALAANKPVITRDLRLQVEMLGRGRYSIALAPDSTNVTQFQQSGMPIKWSSMLKEGTYSTASFGSVIVLDKAPHPNAGRVFLNWLLGKEGQSIWSQASGLASRRLDVPSEHLTEALKPPAPGVTLWPDYKEENTLKRESALAPMREIFSGF